MEMKQWHDSHIFSYTSKVNADAEMNRLIAAVKDSTKLKIVSRAKYKIRLESAQLAWFMAPPLPKFRIRISVCEQEASTQVEIKVLGNALLRFFKYMGVFMLVLAGVQLFLDRSSYVYSISGVLGVVFASIVMHYWNRAYIEEGYHAIRRCTES